MKVHPIIITKYATSGEKHYKYLSLPQEQSKTDTALFKVKSNILNIERKSIKSIYRKITKEL